jgi:hypothetical protein
MKLSALCGVSVDGFLARPDHSLDFLELASRSRTASKNSIAASTSSCSGARPSKSCLLAQTNIEWVFR